MEMATVDWFEAVDRYYLSDFIKSGGSAFKLLLARDICSVPTVLDKVRSLAEEKNYLYVQVSAAETRIDKIDQLFFAIARQIDWESLVTKDAVNFLRSRDYEIPEGVSPGDTAAIAQANDYDLEDLLKEIRRSTKQEIVQDRWMCKEFRTAVAQLRSAQFFPRSVTPSDTETLSGWMKGEKVSAAALKDLRIYSKIGRHNAREMLIALAHWLANSLGMGLVIGLDLSALLLTRPLIIDESVPSLHYSRSALLDAYEVIRQFIDETDDITHCLICAVAPPEIETDEKRSIFKYYALQSRLLSEVHDLDRQDLLASMVRLSDTSDERTGSDG
jgi:hypothetical protein